MPAADDARDRRDDGRPEQARPRDRTGRPLPYGTTDVPLAEEHEPATVEDALALGTGLWAQERFFEAHECLEAVWHAAPDLDRDLWQGVIQIAVASVHIQRGNASGAVSLLHRAADRLEAYPDGHRGIAATSAAADARARAATIERGSGWGGPHPSFPAHGAGAWFAADPAADAPADEPTPVPDGPAWRVAANERATTTRRRRPNVRPDLRGEH